MAQGPHEVGAAGVPAAMRLELEAGE